MGTWGKKHIKIMKNMRNATGILLTAAGLLAAGNSAKAQPAQVIQAPAGQAYAIVSNVPATAVNPVTYQWYRNNAPIAGATEASYTVPAAQAYGDNVQFYRMAKAQECAGEAEKPSNTITITFAGHVEVDGCNLTIGGVCWADVNVDNPNTFATQADMDTKFYQWNRLTTYSTDDPIDPAWNATADQSTTWSVNPCPQDWRLPTQVEYQQLHNAGNTWVDAGVRGAVLAGRFYGYNHATCTLPNNMSGCVFFPASGGRNYAGALVNKGTDGYSWSGTQVSNTNGYYLAFHSAGAAANNIISKACAFPIRCVR